MAVVKIDPMKLPFVRPNRAGASVPEAFGLSAVVEIAKAIGTRLSKPVNTTAVSKIKDTPELKDVFDYQQRLKLLQDAFNVDRDVGGKRILLVDDLYRSGATSTVVAQELLAGGAAAVYMLAITKTQTRT